MFDYRETDPTSGEPVAGLSRAEIEERVALQREFPARIDEREARLRSAIALREAER